MSKEHRVLNRLPSIFVISFLFAYATFMGVAFTPFERFEAFMIYIPYCIAAWVLAIGNVKLCRNSEHKSGKVSVWLVTVTYAYVAFALTLTGVLMLLTTRVLGLSLTVDSEGQILQAISYSMVAGGMVADVIAALVLVYGYKRGLLGFQIHPWPWKKKGNQ